MTVAKITANGREPLARWEISLQSLDGTEEVDMGTALLCSDGVVLRKRPGARWTRWLRLQNPGKRPGLIARTERYLAVSGYHAERVA